MAEEQTEEKPKSKYTNRGGHAGPLGNKHNLKHGLYSLMAQRKNGKPNGRTAFGKAFKARELEYIEAYGGDVSPMERTLITDTVWHDFYVATIDAEIAKSGLMNGGEAHPLLELRPRFAAHRRENIKLMGLKRVSKQLTVNDLLNGGDETAGDPGANGKGD
jgi:hypothetical protein